MNDKPIVLRGVIDSLEDDWALIVLDDEQRLDWPRERLPADLSSGMAITLNLKEVKEKAQEAADVQAQERGGKWEGVIAVRGQAGEQRLSVQLGEQCLIWPSASGFSSGDAVVVWMKGDAGDTERRFQQIRDLVDDLFG
jgi:hypothetical protein